MVSVISPNLKYLFEIIKQQSYTFGFKYF
jgi:hypothetical protein